MKFNIFSRLEKVWFGARRKLVSSLTYEFCYGENLILHYGKQNEKPTHAIFFLVFFFFQSRVSTKYIGYAGTSGNDMLAHWDTLGTLEYVRIHW